MPITQQEANRLYRKRNEHRIKSISMFLSTEIKQRIVSEAKRLKISQAKYITKLVVDAQR